MKKKLFYFAVPNVTDKVCSSKKWFAFFFCIVEFSILLYLKFHSEFILYSHCLPPAKRNCQRDEVKKLETKTLNYIFFTGARSVYIPVQNMFILYFSAAVAVIRNISVLVWQVGTYTVHIFKFARAFSLITFKFFCFVLYFSKAKNSFSCFFLHSFYIFLTLLFCRRLLLFFLLVSLGI